MWLSCFAVVEDCSHTDMKVFKLWLYTIVLAVQHRQARALSMLELCSLWSGSGYIGSPTDCEVWGYCRNNQLVSQGRCGGSFYFDSMTGTCQDANTVPCGPQYWDLCINRLKEEYVADRSDCWRYFTCNDENGGEVRTCAIGFRFNNKLQRCVPSTGVCPLENINLCTYVQGDALLGNPLNCGSYIRCSNGVGHVGVCSAARYFNQKTGECESAQPEHCSGKGNNYKPVWEQPPATDAHICAEFYEDERSGVQYFTDDLTCYGYYVCISRNAMGKWRSCPRGMHFHWWSQKCGQPEDFSCPFDRCGNLDATFVTKINSGCTKYIHCKNQTSNKVFKCPLEFPYFDEKKGACIDDFFNYRVCFMED